ncbi:hypothetical protein [Phenylobacterium sp.]|uniref:hypothetical protein n=1 Tax=Phenylobacterium sp. TaxID=1871053 RepID=UPI002ED9208E
MARLALVASPFTGPAAWRPVAERLPEAVAMDYGGVDGGYEAVARRIAAAMGEGPWIAVLHSGAGGFVPDLAEVASGLAGLIFVDAVRPHPGRSLRDVEPAFVAQLDARAESGRLAPWNRWFDEDPLPRLLPDAAVREAFGADLPRPAVAFLDAVPAASDRWERLPAAYLQLSRRYAPQADWAQSRGWPVERADLHHLAMVSHPAEVAADLVTLAFQVASDR